MQFSRQLIKALQEPPNMLCLATLVALSAALLSPALLLVAAVAETAYLLFVPSSEWYRRRCTRLDRERQRRRLNRLNNRLYPKLHPDLQKRYHRLVDGRKDARRRLKDQPQFSQVMFGLDCLLEKFLVLAAKEVQLRSYVTSTLQFVTNGVPIAASPSAQSPTTFFEMAAEIRNRYKARSRALQEVRDAESDAGRRIWLESQSSVFFKREEFVGEVAEALTVLQGELGKIESTIADFEDSSSRVSMEQAVTKIESVIFEIDTILKPREGFVAYEWLMVRPQQPPIPEIPETRLVEDHAVNTKKLLVSFGLLGVTIAIFGFGTDTINQGLRYVSEYFSITLPEIQHWESWELGALIWTAGFAISFYRDMPLTKDASLNKKIIPLASVGVLVLTAGALITIWKEHFAHVFFVAAIAFLYFWLDQKLSRHIEDAHVKRDFNDSKWLADIPAVVALGVLAIYQVYLVMYLGGEHYHKFLTQTYPHGEHWALFFSGAISFQLVVSTVVFALIQSGAIRKFLHESEALHQ